MINKDQNKSKPMIKIYLVFNIYIYISSFYIL